MKASAHDPRQGMICIMTMFITMYCTGTDTVQACDVRISTPVCMCVFVGEQFMERVLHAQQLEAQQCNVPIMCVPIMPCWRLKLLQLQSPQGAVTCTWHALCHW